MPHAQQRVPAAFRGRLSAEQQHSQQLAAHVAAHPSPPADAAAVDPLEFPSRSTSMHPAPLGDEDLQLIEEVQRAAAPPPFSDGLPLSPPQPTSLLAVTLPPPPPPPPSLPTVPGPNFVAAGVAPTSASEFDTDLPAEPAPPYSELAFVLPDSPVRTQEPQQLQPPTPVALLPQEPVPSATAEPPTSPSAPVAPEDPPSGAAAPPAPDPSSPPPSPLPAATLQPPDVVPGRRSTRRAVPAQPGDDEVEDEQEPVEIPHFAGLQAAARRPFAPAVDGDIEVRVGDLLFVSFAMGINLTTQQTGMFAQDCFLGDPGPPTSSPDAGVNTTPSPAISAVDHPADPNAAPTPPLPQLLSVAAGSVVMSPTSPASPGATARRRAADDEIAALEELLIAGQMDGEEFWRRKNDVFDRYGV
ncbi:hypothetical protein HK405_003749 [Cladochytrium tenue]|nr:hypothetical protein HK405_003749 [Cladochytrium tenue]